MSLHFCALHPNPAPGSATCSLEELLAGIDGLPGRDRKTSDLQGLSHDIKDKAQHLTRSVLKLLVADIDELERRYSTDPSKLRVEILSRIEASIGRIPPADLRNIGSAIGVDPSRYRSPEDFLKALSQEVGDRLTSTTDFSKALDLLAAGNFLELIAGPRSGLLREFDDLVSEVTLALEAFATIYFHPTVPVPPSSPSAPAPVLVPYVAPAIYALIAGRNEIEIPLEQKKPSLLDAIVEACNKLGAAAEAQHQKHKLAEAEEEKEEKKRQQSVEEFADKYPDYKDILKEILGDPHFGEGEISQFNKSLALQRAKESKVA